MFVVPLCVLADVCFLWSSLWFSCLWSRLCFLFGPVRCFIWSLLWFLCVVVIVMLVFGRVSFHGLSVVSNNNNKRRASHDTIILLLNELREGSVKIL